MNMYIHSSGELVRDHNSLVYKTKDRSISIPVKSTKAIFLFGSTTFNTQALWLLAKEKIPLHIFSHNGNHVSTITPHPAQVSGYLTVKQARGFDDNSIRMTVCREIINAASHNIVYNLTRNRLKGVDQIRVYASELTNCKTPEEVMGVEGNIRRVYYESWQNWLSLSSPFKREYRPPSNPVNALVSFLNTLLYSVVVSEIYRTALHPGISFLHAPQTMRNSLALDLSEPFKPIVVDRLIASLWNNREIKESDFEPHSNGVILKEESRKLIVQKFDAAIQRTSYDKDLKRNMSYRGLIRKDCYQLIRLLLEDYPLEFYKIRY